MPWKRAELARPSAVSSHKGARCTSSALIKYFNKTSRLSFLCLRAPEKTDKIGSS